MRLAPPAGSYPKVVVIGAGMAGLSATKELLRRGWPKHKVVLLEASGRLGGRMRTRRHRTGALCDHGAAYIHGTVGNPLAELAKEAGIGLKQVSESNPWIETTPSVSLFCGGERVAAAEAADTHEAFCQLMGRVRALARQCDDANVPAGGAIDKLLLDEPFCSMSAQELSRLRLRVVSLGLWHGCDLKDMQLRSLEFEDKPFRGGQGVYGDFPGPHCVVEGGVERIAEAIASPQIRECLRFHTRVDRVTITNPDKGAAASAPTAAAAAAIVGGGSGTHATCEQGTANLGPDGASAGGDGSGEEEQGDGAVHVSIKKEGTVTTTAVVGERGQGEAEGGAGEVVRADAVIVAVPLSVLQEGAVEFDPPLPEETASALSRLGMGTYEKIIMEFEEPFWPADAPFIGCCCPQPSPLVAPPQPLAVAAAEAAAGGAATLASRPTMTPPMLLGASDGALGSAVVATAKASGSALPALASSLHHPIPTVGALASPAEAAATREAAAEATPAANAATSADSSALSLSPPQPLPPIPIFLENYLWSKGVPVLTAAVTGERARIVSSACAAAAAAAATAAAAAAEAEGTKDGGDADSSWRASHAREMYRRLIKPALVEGLARDGGELPEPVSVFVTSWAEEPLQRGSYSYFPLGARDDDIHKAGQGASYGAPGSEPGAEGSERVFFAGEATVPGLEGSMHGAYLSGVRAAEDVAYAFGLPL